MDGAQQFAALVFRTEFLTPLGTIQNILFSNNSPKADIKLIDFGLSKKYASDNELTEGVGTVRFTFACVTKGVDYLLLGVLTQTLVCRFIQWLQKC